MSRKRSPNGQPSRLLSRGTTLDGRSTEGRFLSAFERELRNHLGGNASVTQTIMIRRLAQIALKLAKLDEQNLTSDFDDGAAKRYLGFSNSLQRGLKILGLRDRPAPKPSLEQHLRTNYGAAREAQPT